MPCLVRAELVPFHGWVLTGSHGERLELGVSEILVPERVPVGACEDFARKALVIFGPRGPRCFERPEPYDPLVDAPIGRTMHGTLEQELAALAAEQRRWGH